MRLICGIDKDNIEAERYSLPLAVLWTGVWMWGETSVRSEQEYNKEYDKSLERKEMEEVMMMEELGGGSIVCACLKERENYWSLWSRSKQSAACKWQFGSYRETRSHVLAPGLLKPTERQKFEEVLKGEFHLETCRENEFWQWCEDE